jgi:four helix bundle protein
VSCIKKFEEIIAWQKARLLTKTIYSVSKSGEFARDFGLSGQIQRAAVSIMSNVAEGFERSSLREFHKFLWISKSSCAEVRSHLYVALDLHYLLPDVFSRLMIQTEEVARIIGALRSSVYKKLKRDG